MAILTSYEGSNDDYENGGTLGYRAQGFKVPSNSVITSVSIFGSKGISFSGTTFFEIRQGTVTGTSLGSISISTSTLSAYGTPIWNEITGLNINVVAGTQYYLVIGNLTGNSNDEIRWSTDTTSPSYPNGNGWYATSVNTGWVEYPSRHKNFRINGNIAKKFIPKILSN